jgi:hypothetical protein|nr:MAG TPA: hypothetical protein [Caudoviricetes sp.]
MTILEAIKKQCKSSGVPVKFAEKIQKLFNIEKEENLENLVQMFKDNILPDLQASETAAEQAKQTVISEYETKHNLKDGKPIEKAEETKLGFEGLSPDIKAILEANQKQIEQLTGTVTSIAKGFAASRKESDAKELFKGSGLPEKWFGRLNLEDEKTPLSDQIKTLQEELAEIKQISVNELVEQGNYKPFNQQPKDRTEKEWLEIMNSEEGAGESNGVASLE